MKKIVLLFLAAAAVLSQTAAVFADEAVRSIVLNNGTAVLDGAAVPEYDYTWHADPAAVHDEVKDAPAEYYTGTKPSGDDAVYIAHDIFYYPKVDMRGYKSVFYNGEREWAYYYPVDEYKDYIWATLPMGGNDIPMQMMHGEEDAWNNPVLHITKPGTYEISGTWHGQIWVDLGDSDVTFTDESAKVVLILNGANVTCDVAPALVFYSVYEADNGWESRDSYGPEVDISNAGAKVILADDSVNNLTGTNVYRMLKAEYKDENSAEVVKVQKKLRKLDGAFYSFSSLLIDGQEKGNGALHIYSGYEGMGAELHLTFNGGKVSIQSQDDGINVNEDDVSVVTINGGELHIAAGLGMEGDGLDSNGYLVINDGVVIAAAKPLSDSGLDSSKGSFINGGYVVSTGSIMDWPETDSRQVTMNLQFVMDQAPDEAVIVTDKNNKVIFAYDPDKDETAGPNNRGYRGAVISSPEFKTGETYYVYIGGNVDGEEVNGLYDVSTVTGFNGAVRQIFAENGSPEIGADAPEGGPEAVFKDIEGFTMIDQNTVSITESAAAEIIAFVKEKNSGFNVSVEEIVSITDAKTLFDLLRPDNGSGQGNGGMGGPGGMMGPGGMGGPGGMMGPGGMGGPGGMMGPGGMGGPGGMMGGPGGFSGSNFGNQDNVETSAEFVMNDIVNTFNGVADER